MNAIQSSTLQAPLLRFAHFGLLACALVFSVLAPRAAHADVPGRVGRIAFMEGDVQAYSETDPEWKVAYLNQPITSRQSVFVGDAGRAEISVGSTTLAMDAGSQVDIRQLDDNTFEANVVRGRISMRVRRLDPNDVYTLAVPGAEFELLQPGRYRVDALSTSGGITVFAGRASVDGDRGPVTVEAGNGLRVVVDSNDPNAPPRLSASAPVAVPLDDWVVAREARFRAPLAERYVSQNMTGYEDLDANGRWSTEEDVGPVWYPTAVQADWAPYRYGRWAYVAPWGYTWIDDAPWGFAPFHYGRWVQVGSRWGWAPGAYIQRPVYAPALVGFYGGAGFSASFSIGVGPAVGWYPLAPWQRYSPHYTQNTAYINQVNNIRIVNPPRRYADNGGRDWNREHGGTLAPQQAFASQRSISRVAIAAPRNLIERANPVAVADLPRPAIIPGAVRRGPEGRNFDGHPEFRSPREFANRPNDGPRQTAPIANAPAAGPQGPRVDDRNGLPPNYRRMQEERRPAVVTETARPVQGEAGAQFPRNQNGGGFNRENRPQPQQPVAQGVPAGEGQGMEMPRYNPRLEQRPQQVQPQQVPQPAAVEQRQFERPNREMRNVQPQPQGQPERQVIEQRQQRFERPNPQQAPAILQPQPAAPQGFERPQQQPRFERPQPPAQVQQPVVERQQRIERPAPPPVQVAPPAPVAQPRPVPQVQQAGPRGDGDRGGAILRDRER